MTTETAMVRLTNASKYSYRFYLWNRKRVTLNPGAHHDLPKSDLEPKSGLNKHLLKIIGMGKLDVSDVPTKAKVEKKAKSAKSTSDAKK